MIIVNSKGLAIRSTMSSNATIENGQVISGFLNGAIAKIQQIHEEETIILFSLETVTFDGNIFITRSLLGHHKGKDTTKPCPKGNE